MFEHQIDSDSDTTKKIRKKIFNELRIYGLIVLVIKCIVIQDLNHVL